MPGTVKQFVDFSSNTAADTGENTAASIQPILNGETLDQTVMQRPSEGLRQRTEAVRNIEVDSLFLRDADRNIVIAGPGLLTWPGSTTAAASGIPIISDNLYILPLLTPGFAQTAPVPPVASAFGTLHLKRASDSMNSIVVTSKRRSYAAGDQISVQVTPGGVFSCVLDSETGYQRTVKIVATGATTLSTVITALTALAPTTIGDTALLLLAALEGGALGTDLLLTTQAKQFVAGNYDGEGHTITPANLASFFVSNPAQALAEGDSLCVNFPMVSDTATTGGRRQALPENTNTAIPAGAFFNSRSHPENLVNALPICKVVNNRLVFNTGSEIAAGSVNVDLSTTAASSISYAGGPAWADGTTNPATTVEGQLDKIVTDLAGATGTAKVQGSAVGGDLAAQRLSLQIVDLVNNWLKLSRANTVTGANLFNALQTMNGASDLADAMQTLTPPNTGTKRPKPLWSILVDAAAGIRVRLYSLYEGGFMLTFNAAVTGMTGPDPDYTIDALTYTIGAGTARCFKVLLKAYIAVPNGQTDFSFSWYDPATASPFADSAWIPLMLLEEGRLRLGATTPYNQVHLDLTEGIGKVKEYRNVRFPIVASTSLVTVSTVSNNGGSPGAVLGVSCTAYFPIVLGDNVGTIFGAVVYLSAAAASPTFRLQVASRTGTFTAIGSDVTSGFTGGGILIFFGSTVLVAGDSLWLKVTTPGGGGATLQQAFITGLVT